jgi:hypothetical protein
VSGGHPMPQHANLKQFTSFVYYDKVRKVSILNFHFSSVEPHVYIRMIAAGTRNEFQVRTASHMCLGYNKNLDIINKLHKQSQNITNTGGKLMVLVDVQAQSCSLLRNWLTCNSSNTLTLCCGSLIHIL